MICYVALTSVRLPRVTDSEGIFVHPAPCSPDEECAVEGWFGTFSILLRAPFDDFNQIDISLPQPVPALSKTLLMLYEVALSLTALGASPLLIRQPVFLCGRCVSI